MTKNDVFELIDRFEHSTLYNMKLVDGDFSLEMSKSQGNVPAVIEPSAPKMTAAPQAAQEVDNEVTAPLVGMFYTAPAPGEAPFVSVGDRVTAGQTLCLMEAMKMLSEVPAPCDCIITEIVKSNGELAAFGDPLFRYKPC